MAFDTLTPEAACRAISGLGLSFEPSDVCIEARDERWLAHLPGQRLGWFAQTDNGLRRLIIERRVLRLLQARCTFDAPRVILEDPSGLFDVRSMAPGTNDWVRIFSAVSGNRELSKRIGKAIGEILAQQHTRITGADVTGWLPEKTDWPESRQWIRDRLIRVIDDPRLLAEADEIIVAYENTVVSESDRVLVHGDVGFHNLAFDPESLAVRGIFDYAEAAWADRHHDFRSLLFDLNREELLDAALCVYEPAVGRPIQRQRVFLYNAACAITHLAYRDGTPGDAVSCGRTLAEDLRWSKHAIFRAQHA